MAYVSGTLVAARWTGDPAALWHLFPGAPGESRQRAPGRLRVLRPRRRAAGPRPIHLAVTFDAAVWLALGGFLITLAAVFAHAAPIRSTYLQACGIGQVAGLIGSYTRLTGTTAIADRYASAVPDQQAALLRSYLDIWLTVTSHFSAGGLLWSSGLVLTASVAWTRGAFPRWLAIGIDMPGIMMLAQQLANLILGADIGFLFCPAIMLLVLDFFALAWRFWRPTAAS